MMKRNYFASIIVLLIVGVLPHFAAVLQPEGKEAVITKTQTDPIAYKTKTEELKEGPKGAAIPTFKYYGHNKFLSELPVEGDKKSGRKSDSAKSVIPEPGDPIPEDLSGIEEEAMEEDWWLEDWSEPTSDQ